MKDTGTGSPARSSFARPLRVLQSVTAARQSVYGATQNIIDRAALELWFLPSLIVLGSGALAITFIEIDSRFSFTLSTNFPRLFGAGAEGSRGMLSSIASSMITVAGVTFSITIVALSQASNQ